MRPLEDLRIEASGIAWRLGVGLRVLEGSWVIECELGFVGDDVATSVDVGPAQDKLASGRRSESIAEHHNRTRLRRRLPAQPRRPSRLFQLTILDHPVEPAEAEVADGAVNRVIEMAVDAVLLKQPYAKGI